MHRQLSRPDELSKDASTCARPRTTALRGGARLGVKLFSCSCRDLQEMPHSAPLVTPGRPAQIGNLSESE